MNIIAPISKRFRGLLPLVIDIETSGLNPQTDAILEIAIVSLKMDERGYFTRDKTFQYQVEAFSGANIEKESLRITGIDPEEPLRYAIPEYQALERLNAVIKDELQKNDCFRAVFVGHNVWFDLHFLLAVAARYQITKLPFHTFTTFDTASLSAIFLGETVLARAAKRARIPFDIHQAHSAIYDAEKTADLFCYFLNRSDYSNGAPGKGR